MLDFGEISPAHRGEDYSLPVYELSSSRQSGPQKRLRASSFLFYPPEMEKISSPDEKVEKSSTSTKGTNKKKSTAARPGKEIRPAAASRSLLDARISSFHVLGM
jgi:hypothetical protein